MFGATKESMNPCSDGNLVAPLIRHRPSHLGSYSKSSCYECKNKKSHTPRFGLPVAWGIHKLWTLFRIIFKCV